MIKLLQINSVVNTGSTGRIAEQLGQLAISQGWESYIAYGREAKESKSKLIKIGTTFDIYFHVVISRLFDRHGLMSKRATWKFLKQLDQIQPDIVHLHNIHGYYINYPMLFRYLKEKNIPTVITMHDFWLMTGHCAYINESCNRWKTGCGNCPRLDQYPAAKTDFSAKNWQKKASIFADMPNLTIVPVSYWLSQYVNKSLLRDVKQQVIRNGIDTLTFRPFNKEFSNVSKVDWSKFTIMTIATQWTKSNGYNDVLRLSYLLPENTQIIMIGLSNEQLLKLPKNVVGFNKTENFTQLQEFYTRSDVLFNPNREVTFGLVTVEAMACGTPAIVFRNTAGEEIVNEKTGYVIDSIYEIPKLIHIINNKSFQVAQVCRDWTVENFDYKNQYQKYFELYSDLILNR